MSNMLRRIGVIGDVHAQHVQLESLLAFLSHQNLDRLFCVGDVVDGVGSVDRCCELLTSNNVATVQGNHDQWCLEHSNRAFAGATCIENLSESSRSCLESLPRTLLVETVIGKAMICHGIGEHNLAQIRPTDSVECIFDNLELWELFRDDSVRMAINGHSHKPGLWRFDHLTIVNAGSLEDSGTACAVVIDFRAGLAEFYRVGGSNAVERCDTKRWPSKFVRSQFD